MQSNGPIKFRKSVVSVCVLCARTNNLTGKEGAVGAEGAEDKDGRRGEERISCVSQYRELVKCSNTKKIIYLRDIS